jgi:hypothetical protein
VFVQVITKLFVPVGKLYPAYMYVNLVLTVGVPERFTTLAINVSETPPYVTLTTSSNDVPPDPA